MALVKASKMTVIILTVAAVAVAGITLAVLTTNQNVPTSGLMVAGPNVGVYSNSGCTSTLTSINWGSIEAGGTTSQVIYIKNTGGTQMVPSITVTNWNPSTATSYITLTWSSLPAEIQPGASMAVTFTLSVSSSVTGNSTFSNTITITGTG